MCFPTLALCGLWVSLKEHVARNVALLVVPSIAIQGAKICAEDPSLQLIRDEQEGERIRC
jgi:hypothetical protein